jgi:dihydrofolate synthase / folylpolyglutamate synthase
MNNPVGNLSVHANSLARPTSLRHTGIAGVRRGRGILELMNPSYAEVQQLLLKRWPESRIEPSFDRIRAICDMLGDPQDSFQMVQLTGTNGKTSTSRMIDELVRTLGLRTGRFTSPHLQHMNERISLDGEPLSDEAFVDAYADVAVYADLVDAQQPHPLSFFEMMVAMAYAAFADAPIDVAVVEVGLGGSWDATSVAEADVPVILPIDLDHTQYLGDTLEAIALEKAGIIKPGARAVFAQQDPRAEDVLMRRANEVGVPVVREGVDFGVEARVAAVGGQQFTVQGVAGRYADILMPLHGHFQASNAAVAIAAVEQLTGGKELDADLVREAFSQASSPGRLEVVRRSPTVVIDGAHNVAGARALAEAVSAEFTFSPLVAVVAMMADKDISGVLETLEPLCTYVVCSQNSAERCMPAAELADIAEGIFGERRVVLAPRLDEALEQAIILSETAEGYEDAVGSAGVLVTGSIVTAGEARTLLGTQS